MSVTVVTPWLNHLELADAYFKATRDADEVIIVDNGSTPPLHYCDDRFEGAIRFEENRGFCFASNVGLHRAKSQAVVFLNNDITGGRVGWPHLLAEAVLDRPRVLAGARLRYDRHADVDGQPWPYLDGWCITGRKKDLIRLGGFDDTLAEPGYFCDNLLCLEARAAGFTLEEVPTGLLHLENVTANDRPERVEPAARANYARYQERARELMRVTV